MELLTASGHSRDIDSRRTTQGRDAALYVGNTMLDFDTCISAEFCRRIDGALIVNDSPEVGMLPLCLLEICKNTLFSDRERYITCLDVCI